MRYERKIKEAFVLVGYSAPGKWEAPISYPIPALWKQSAYFIDKHEATEIVGVCLPGRSDHYFYTCGMELDAVMFDRVEEGMTVHTFPAGDYLVFTHTGDIKHLPETYGQIWGTMDKEGHCLKAGMPEIEVVSSHLFGQEASDSYQLDIWIPIETT